MISNPLKSLVLLLSLLVLVSGRMAAEVKRYDFSSGRGLKMKIIQDPSVYLIYAEVCVFFVGDSAYLSSPAIPRLTLLNMFGDNSSALVSELNKLGADFQVEQNPEYAKISVTFPPERLDGFVSFLKELYSYGGLTLKRFLESKKDYLKFLQQGREWKKDLAFQLAYSQLFTNSRLGRTLVTLPQIRTTNLAQVRSFYEKNFRQDKSLLVIKGNFNPYYLKMLVERALTLSLRTPAGEAGSEPVTEKPVINNSRRVFLIPVNDNEPPLIFFFDIAPAFNDFNFIPFFIVNYTLFHYPNGRLYQSERNSDIFLSHNYQMSNELFNHRGLAVLCDSVRVNAIDIESVITRVDQEKKRLTLRPLERNELGNALNYLIGKTEVDSGQPGQEVDVEVNAAINPGGEEYYAQFSSPELFQKVNLEKTNNVAEDYFLIRQKAGLHEKGLIIIVGNAAQVLASLKTLKPEVVDFFGI